jgi:hypothetical protein
MNRGLVAPNITPTPSPLELSLPLEGDHARPIEDSLQRMAKELQLVKRRLS